MSSLELQHVIDGLRGLRLRGPFVYKEITDSTNDEARQAALAGAAEGTAFVAEQQRQGRGRQGRAWSDVPGKSLLLSLILRPSLEPAMFPLLANMAAVAVAEACGGFCGCTVQTKWPNDVLVQGRKVAGILIEGRLPGFAVVGIGVNVLQQGEDFPSELAHTAGSLAMAAVEAPAREAVLSAILNHLDENYDLLLSGHAETILERQRYREVTLGRRIVAETGRRRVSGVVTDLAPDGGLRLHTDAGERLLRSGEVVRVHGLYGETF